jgi:serine/threonine-protein kinase RsbW
MKTVNHLRLTVRMPRRPATVTQVRRLVARALVGIGVVDVCRDDILLALTEACANAVEHARAGDDYEVVVTVDRERCVVEVVDNGVVTEPLWLGSVPPVGLASRGRGLHIIGAVTDGLELRRLDPHGLAVRMTKILAWAPGFPGAWLDAQYEPWSIVPTRARPGDPGVLDVPMAT